MLNKKDSEAAYNLKLLLQELNENPYKKLYIAFALMSVIPILVFVYLIAARLFSLDILCGDIGLIVIMSMAVSFLGFFLGYKVLENVINKLVQYAAKVKHRDRAKSEFVAFVAHELKSPLSVIKMNLANFRDGLLGAISDEQRRSIELSQGVVDRMHHLINDILDIHKIETGNVKMDRKLCDIPRILEKQTKEFGPIAEKKRIRIVKDVSGRNLFIWADEGKITQVVNNLLGNAIKYTPESGFVRLNTFKSDEFVRMEFEDTAPAIPQDNLEDIFDKFRRLENKAEGTGLGLAIVRDIVEMHRGRIWAEPGAVNGNRFIVVLPSDLRGKKISESSDKLKSEDLVK